MDQIDSNCHLLYGNRRHDQLTYIVVNQWNMVTCGYEIRRDEVINEVIELDQVQTGYY